METALCFNLCKWTTGSSDYFRGTSVDLDMVCCAPLNTTTNTVNYFTSAVCHKESPLISYYGWTEPYSKLRHHTMPIYVPQSCHIWKNRIAISPSHPTHHSCTGMLVQGYLYVFSHWHFKNAIWSVCSSMFLMSWHLGTHTTFAIFRKGIGNFKKDLTTKAIKRRKVQNICFVLNVNLLHNITRTKLME